MNVFYVFHQAMGTGSILKVITIKIIEKPTKVILTQMLGTGRKGRKIFHDLFCVVYLVNTPTSTYRRAGIRCSDTCYWLRLISLFLIRQWVAMLFGQTQRLFPSCPPSLSTFLSLVLGSSG